MAEQRKSGSRYLYEPFDANKIRIETQGKIVSEKFTSIERRLGLIEAGLSRLERRLWMSVYGIVAVVVSSGVASLLE